MKAMPGLCVAALCAAALATVSAQQKPDPRVGLKPGLHDAGEAAWNLERVVNLPKPEPPDRFLESGKRAKIVKSVVTSKAMPPAQ